MMTEMDWYRIRSEAFTAIRCEFSVSTLEVLAEEENETPVSGDRLAEERQARMGLDYR